MKMGITYLISALLVTCVSLTYYLRQIHVTRCLGESQIAPLAPVGSSMNRVLVAPNFHSADCGTDHSLVVSKVRLLLKRTNCSRQKRLPLISTCGKAMPELRVKLGKTIDEALDDCPTDSVKPS